MSDNLNSGSLLSSLSGGTRPSKTTTSMTTGSPSNIGGFSNQQKRTLLNNNTNAPQTTLLSTNTIMNEIASKNQNTQTFNSGIMRQVGAIDAAANRITTAIGTQTKQLVTSITNMSNAITESINSLKEGINHIFYERANAYSEKIMDEEIQKDYDRYAKDFIKTFFSEKIWGAIAAASDSFVSLSKAKEQTFKYLMQNKAFADLLGVEPYGSKRSANNKMVPFTKEIADAIIQSSKYLNDIANSVNNVTENQSRSLSFFGNEYTTNSERLIDLNEEILRVMTQVGNVVTDFKNAYVTVNHAPLQTQLDDVNARINRLNTYLQGVQNNGGDTQANRNMVLQQLRQQRAHAQEIEDAYREREEHETSLREQTNRRDLLVADVRRLDTMITNLRANPTLNNNQALQRMLADAINDRNQATAQVRAVSQEIVRYRQIAANVINAINIPAGTTREGNLRNLRNIDESIEDLNTLGIGDDLVARVRAREDDLRRAARQARGINRRVPHLITNSTQETRNARISRVLESLNMNTYALRHNTDEIKKNITAMSLMKDYVKAALNPKNIWNILSTGSRFVMKFMMPFYMYKLGLGLLLGKGVGGLGEGLHNLIKWPFRLLGGIGVGNGKTIGDLFSSGWDKITKTLSSFYNNHLVGIWEGIKNQLQSFKETFIGWIGEKWWMRIYTTFETMKKYTKLVWDAFLNPDEENAKVARQELYRPIYDYIVDAIQKYLVPGVMQATTWYVAYKNLKDPIEFAKELVKPVTGLLNLSGNVFDTSVGRYVRGDMALDRAAANVVSNTLPRDARNIRFNNNADISSVYYSIGDNPFTRALYNVTHQGSRNQGVFSRLIHGVRRDVNGVELENIRGEAAQHLMDSEGVNHETAQDILDPENRSILRPVGRFFYGGGRFIKGVFNGIWEFLGALKRGTTWLINIGATLSTIGGIYAKIKDRVTKQQTENKEKGEEKSWIATAIDMAKSFITGQFTYMLNNIVEAIDVGTKVIPEIVDTAWQTFKKWLVDNGPTMWNKIKNLLIDLSVWIGQKFKAGFAWGLDKLAEILPDWLVKSKGQKIESRMAELSALTVTDSEQEEFNKKRSEQRENYFSQMEALNKQYGYSGNVAEAKDLFSALVQVGTLVKARTGRTYLTRADIEEHLKHSLIKDEVLEKLFESGIAKEKLPAYQDAMKYISLNDLHRNVLMDLDKEDISREKYGNDFLTRALGPSIGGLKLLSTNYEEGLSQIRNTVEIFRKAGNEFNGSDLHDFFMDMEYALSKTKDNTPERTDAIMYWTNKFELEKDKMLKKLYGEYAYTHTDLDPEKFTKDFKNITDEYVTSIEKAKTAIASEVKAREEYGKEEQARKDRIAKEKEALEKAKKEARDKEQRDREISEKASSFAKNGVGSLGVVAQWVQSGQFKEIIEKAFNFVGDKIGAVINFFKKQDYGKLFSDAMSGLGSMTGGILSALFGSDKADNFSRAAYAYADKHNLKFAKSFFGGARKSILMSVDDLVSHAAKTGQNVEEIKVLLRSFGVKDNDMPSGGGGEVVTPFTGNRGMMTTAGSITEGITADMFKDTKTGIAKGNVYDSDTSLKISLASTLFPNEGYRTNEHEKIYPNAKYDRSSYNQDFHSRMGLYAIDLPKVAALVANTYGNTKIIDKIMSDKDLRNLVTVKTDGKKTTYEARSGGDIMNMSNRTYRNSIISKLNDLAHMSRDHKGIIDENTWKEMIFQYIKSTRWKEFGFNEFKYIPAIYSEILDTAWWMGNGAARSVVAKAINKTLGVPLDELKGMTIKQMMGHKTYRPLLEGKQFKFLQNIFNAALGRAGDVQWKRDRITRNMRVLGVPSTSGDYAIDITDKSNYSGSNISNISDYGHGVTSKNFSSELNELVSSNAYSRLNKPLYKLLSTDDNNNEYTRIINLFKNERQLMNKVAEIEKKNPSEWSKDEAQVMAKFAGLLDKYNALATKEGANTTVFYNAMTEQTTNITNLLEKAIAANKGITREEINAARQRMLEGIK